jgi:hypothetical protein
MSMTSMTKEILGWDKLSSKFEALPPGRLLRHCFGPPKPYKSQVTQHEPITDRTKGWPKVPTRARSNVLALSDLREIDERKQP